MRYLPIHVDTRGYKIAVIGGGDAAEAKLRTLILTEAEITVYADELNPEIVLWKEQGKLKHLERDINDAEIRSAQLVYAATKDDEVNARLSRRIQGLGKLVNAADYQKGCSFITPAIVDRSPVVVSIGTEGASPGLSRAIKADLESRLPSGLGRLAEHIRHLRAKVKTHLPNIADRQRLWGDILGRGDLQKVLRQSEDKLTAQVDAVLNGKPALAGHVALVGAGPGNPDLLTYQARQALAAADVVIYDRLVSKDVLSLSRREAEYIHVGKTPYGKTITQDEITALIVEKASEGLFVVRLKGGDPLIFARADEEIDALKAHGLSYTLCPGITSAAAAAAALGVSLTSRGKNSAVSFMTGHDTKGFAEQDWRALAEDGGRAAVYMGLKAARFIQGRLLMFGADPNKPVTIVENASRSEQRIVESCVGALADDLTREGVSGPAILMVGYEPSYATSEARNVADVKELA